MGREGHQRRGQAGRHAGIDAACHGKQAEAEREKRSKIIHAEGEFSAAQRLVDAAHLLSTEPVSVQLRYLQTLTEIGVEKNTTVVFPVPVDFFREFRSCWESGDGDPAPAKTA